MRMIDVAVAGLSPVLRPSRSQDERLAADVQFGHGIGPDDGARRVDDHTGHARHRLQRDVGEIVAVGETMERCVQVGTGVGDHLDAADLDLGAGGSP